MVTRLTEQDFVVSTWSGGTTTQLAICPQGAVYGDRNFQWRMSSATVELETSDFTPLPDYHRFIATLDAPIVLTHNGGEKLALSPLSVHQFDGGDATVSAGCCTDFNLMVRKGQCTAQVEVMHLTETETLPPVEGGCHAIFCATGTATALGHTLSAGELLLVEDQRTSYSVCGAGCLFFCAISW